jgi:hypothetical protein
MLGLFARRVLVSQSVATMLEKSASAAGDCERGRGDEGERWENGDAMSSQRHDGRR